MITAKFYNDAQNRMLGFHISGHAGFADVGSDIACASVSSAVMMTVNAVTDVFKLNAKVKVDQNDILLKLLNDSEGQGDKLILSLLVHINELSKEFAGCIKVETKKV